MKTLLTDYNSFDDNSKNQVLHNEDSNFYM